MKSLKRIYEENTNIKVKNIDDFRKETKETGYISLRQGYNIFYKRNNE